MLKRFTLLVLSVVMAMNTLVPAFTASAAESTEDILVSLVKKFPQGKYWNHMGSSKNNPDKVTDTPCKSHNNCSWQEGVCDCNSFDNAIQCMGYAYKIAYEITGVSARKFDKSTSLSASKLRVGDVIRFNGHSICVTGVSGNKIAFTDCNWDYKCGIRWGVMDISSLKNFSYVLHLDSNNRKNTDLDFYEGIKPEENEEEVKEPPKEIWRMSDDNLNIRKTASTSAQVVGKIPADTKYTVYEKKISSNYLWGKVKYSGISGWVALNYSEYLSGAYETPELTGMNDSYESRKISLSWKSVSGAQNYQLRVYDKNGKCIEKYETKEPEYTFTVDANGSYSADVVAVNSFCPSWQIASEKVNFTVNEKPEGSVEEIRLSEGTKSIVIGNKYTLKAEVLPQDATDKTVTWKSSKKSVATVSEKGVVTAVSYGTANITCTSSDGKITAKCKVTVTPLKVKNFKQVVSKTTTAEIALSWDKVADADGYTIKRYDSSKKAYITLATSKTNSFTDKTVKAGKKHTYVVSAFVKIDSDKISGTDVKIQCSSDPAKVTGFKQSASASGSVTLKWNKAANATCYVVYKYNSKTKKYEKYKKTTNTTLKVSQTASSSAKYRVRAVTETEWGNCFGSYSAVITATAGPKKVTAKLTNAGKGKVKVSWNKVSGATHYQIYRLQSGKFKKIKTVSSKYNSYTNTGLKSKTDYQYKVRAVKVKNGGKYYASYSSKVTIKTK